jgi:hypothetical protein
VIILIWVGAESIKELTFVLNREFRIIRNSFVLQCYSAMSDKLFCTFYGDHLQMDDLVRLCAPFQVVVENKNGQELRHLQGTISNFDSARLEIHPLVNQESAWAMFRELMERVASDLAALGCDEVDVFVVQNEAMPYIMDSRFAQAMSGLKWNITYARNTRHYGNPWEMPTSQVGEP